MLISDQVGSLRVGYSEVVSFMSDLLVRAFRVGEESAYEAGNSPWIAQVCCCICKHKMLARKRGCAPTSMDESESTLLTISPIERFDTRLAAHIWRARNREGLTRARNGNSDK